MSKGIIAGIALTLIVGFVGGYILISFGFIPANADGKPPALEKWLARKSLRATLEREAPQTPNPVALNDQNLIAGINLYDVNCAVCHGASDAKPSNIAIGLYQRAPQLMKHGVEDDPDGKIYWFIKHGVRLTGMPAFGPTLTDEQLWQLTLFLKHMDSLTPEAKNAWKSVPSSAPRS